MKKFKSTINIIIWTLIVLSSILFIARSLNSPYLFAAGFIIAPVSVIYFNKKCKVKPLRYSLGIVGIICISITLNACSTPKDTSTDEGKQQEIATTDNKDEDVVNKEETTTDKVDKDTSNKGTEDIFAGYKSLEVDGGNLSGHREPNVVVDIGFGDREYYAFTNEYGQLAKVIAKEITIQDDSKEPVNSKGRYYNDEAKVPGVENKDLDEGHVIADSLGGVSNAYNITPQNSTLNRNGDQAYMEKVIRDAGGCSDFVAIITYPDTTTQIPSHYSYTYTLKGNVINDEFDNVNPDEVNDNLGLTGESNNNNSNSGTSANNEEVITTGGSGAVYWTPNGNSYHTSNSCSTLSRSKTILSGTLQESGKGDPCDRCH